MNPDESIANDMSGLDHLLLDSTLAGIEEEAPPSQIETVLRSLAGAIADADPIRRAVVRDALIRRLRRAGVSCPVTLANVALGPEQRSQFRERDANACPIPQYRTLAGTCPWRIAPGRYRRDIASLHRVIPGGRRCRGALVFAYLCS